MTGIPPHLRGVASGVIVLVPPSANRGAWRKRNRSPPHCEATTGAGGSDDAVQTQPSSKEEPLHAVDGGRGGASPDDGGTTAAEMEAHLVEQLHAAPFWGDKGGPTCFLEMRRASLPADVWAPLLRSMDSGFAAHARRLVALDLEGSRLCKGALAHLTGALRGRMACLQSVTCWFLGSTSLDVEGLRALVDAWLSLGSAFRNALRMVGLTNNPTIGSDAACIVSLLTQFPSLARLHLNHVGLTPTVWREMHAALTLCANHTDPDADASRRPAHCGALEKLWMKQNKALNVDEVQHDLNRDATGRLQRTVML